MTLLWIGNAVLLLVIVPVVVYLLKGVLDAANSIVPAVDKIAAVAAAGSKDLDAAALLLTTQDQVAQTVAGVAGYGGSLDVILDDTEEAVTAPGCATLVLLIVLASLLPGFEIVELLAARAWTSDRRRGRDRGESAPVNDVVTRSTSADASGANRGLLVRRRDARRCRLIEGLYQGPLRRLERLPREHHVDAPRIGEVYPRARSRSRGWARGADRRAHRWCGLETSRRQLAAGTHRTSAPRPGEPARLAGNRRRAPTSTSSATKRRPSKRFPSSRS